jgi:hypothetical protein
MTAKKTIVEMLRDLAKAGVVAAAKNNRRPAQQPGRAPAPAAPAAPCGKPCGGK